MNMRRAGTSRKLSDFRDAVRNKDVAYDGMLLRNE